MRLKEGRRISPSGVREHEDRHRLDLLRLECAVECRHDAAAPFDDRLMYRGAVRAPEIQIRACQVRRPDRVIPGPVNAMAIEAIALGAIMKQDIATGRSGRIRRL